MFNSVLMKIFLFQHPAMMLSDSSIKNEIKRFHDNLFIKLLPQNNLLGREKNGESL